MKKTNKYKIAIKRKAEKLKIKGIKYKEKG